MNLLLVLGKGDGHAGEVVVDGLEESADGVVALVVLSVANPGLLGVLKQLQPVLGLLLGVIPAFLDPLDIALKELRLVGVFQDLLTLLNQIIHNIPLGIQLDKGLLLPLDELINILHAGGSNVTD